MKKQSLLTPIVISATLAVGIFIGGKLHFSDSPEQFFATNSSKDKLNRLIDYIDYEYVDPVNADSIVDVTVNTILEQLDPHSVYIPKSEMAEVTETMRGDFVGIGIQFYPYKDTVAVIKTIKGGPSELAGILPGDRILMADKDTLYGKYLKNNNNIMELLKGEENTPVSLQVYRKNTNKTMTLTLRRGVIPKKSITATYMLTDALGYMQLDRFSETSFVEFTTAFNTLQQQGAKRLVLDLRDNPGGYVGVAEQIADAFLGKDKVIVMTKNKHGEINTTYATDKGVFENKEVYVLLNERSASASEIVAGALQDNDVGTIVGRRSFGKGLVQREMALGDGSAVRLTVSRYYTPTGRSIQRPYENGNDAYFEGFAERFYSGELQSRDSIKVADSLKYTTPKGKVVYGGGGIIPDVFVPIGTDDSIVLQRLNAGGIFSYYAFEHLDVNRSNFNGYSKADFIANYKVDDIMYEDFMGYLRRSNINIPNVYEAPIKQFVKAALGAQLFGDDVGAKLSSGEDTMLKKIMELEIARNLE